MFTNAHDLGCRRRAFWLYTLTYFASIALTLLAYWIRLPAVIWPLAALQGTIQLVVFLHLGRESQPKWNLLFFYFMLFIAAIVLVLSLWIMYHLNYNMMQLMDMH